MQGGKHRVRACLAAAPADAERAGALDDSQSVAIEPVDAAQVAEGGVDGAGIRAAGRRRGRIGVENQRIGEGGRGVRANKAGEYVSGSG